MSGTPKTLKEALQNAKEEINSFLTAPRVCEADLVIIESHIRDFVAQRFSTAMIRGDGNPIEQEIQKLWHELFPPQS